MELVVGRIAKSHGITGELVVDVRTDDPRIGSVGKPLAAQELPHPARPRNGHRIGPPARRSAPGPTGGSHRPRQCRLRGGLSSSTRPNFRPSRTPDEFYDHQLEGMTVRTVDGRRIGAVVEVLHTRAANCSRYAPIPLARCWSPSSARSSPRSRWPTGCWTSIRPRVFSTWRPECASTSFRFFPDYLEPIRQSLPGKAMRPASSTSWCTTCGTGHDVHHSVDDSPVRGGPGMVMKAPVWVGARRDLHGRNTSGGADAGRSAVRPGRRTAVDRSEDHLVFACGRYEGSTSGWPTTPRPGCGSRKSPSATTCSPGRGRGVGDDRGGGTPPPECHRQSAFPPGRFAFRVGGSSAGGPSYTRPPVWRGLAVPDVHCCPETTPKSPRGDVIRR